MKKIFWTSIIFLLIITLFRIYARFFDADFGNKVAPLFSKEIPVQISLAQTGDTVFDTLDALDTDLDILTNKITEIKIQANQTPAVQEPAPPTSTEQAIWDVAIKLYYFNEKEDKLLPPEQQASPQSLAPVFRTIPASDSIVVIEDTIRLLLQGALTESEVMDGFTSSFVKVIRLVDTSLNANGTLSLTFTKAPGASIWWSAFIGILTNSIIKTAQQFPQVKKVKLLPEELFQP